MGVGLLEYNNTPALKMFINLVNGLRGQWSEGMQSHEASPSRIQGCCQANEKTAVNKGQKARKQEPALEMKKSCVSKNCKGKTTEITSLYIPSFISLIRS